MPNPIRRHSRGRGRRRRAHWKLTATKLVACPQCKAPKLSHRVCTVCGYYQGRLVIDVQAKKAKREEKKKGKAKG